MLNNQKLQWIIVIAFMILCLFFFNSETFVPGEYPKVYQNYQTDDWHKYWQKRQENSLDGLPDFDSAAEASYKLGSRDFYPILIEGKHRAIGFNKAG